MKREQEIREQLAEVIKKISDPIVQKEVKTLLLGKMDALAWVLSSEEDSVGSIVAQRSGWDEWNNGGDNR
jgi:hypothetical protein